MAWLEDHEAAMAWWDGTSSMDIIPFCFGILFYRETTKQNKWLSTTKTFLIRGTIVGVSHSGAVICRTGES